MSRRCSLVVLVLLDLGNRPSVVSVCTGSFRWLAARLGDKGTDKPQLGSQLARGVRPVLGDHRPRSQAAGRGAAVLPRRDLILIRHIRGMRPSW